MNKIKQLSDQGILVKDIKAELGEIIEIDHEETQDVKALAFIPAIKQLTDNQVATQEQLDAINAKLDRLLNKRSWWDRLIDRIRGK